MSNVWFTADEHYGHANIINFCKRPFSNTEEMREVLIENHNKVVKKGDRVYHIGDMFWRTVPLAEAMATVSRLNGQQYYIYGNHDELFRHETLCKCFVWCRERENLSIQGLPNIVLDHYAGRVWNGSHRGAYQLYGHTHNVLPEGDYLSMDVGVDAQNFYPINLDVVVTRMRQKKGKFEQLQWKCECGHSFLANDTAKSKICAKCTKEMEIV